jgi:hypothetical protein
LGKIVEDVCIKGEKMRRFGKYVLLGGMIGVLLGCISITNKTVEGAGTPDITECSSIAGVLDGRDFVPRTTLQADEADGRVHPDVFSIAWAELNSRIDLRFPQRGYDDGGFEDKLLVSRKDANGSYTSWQIYPPLDENCQDLEKVRIQSFDVAPDGKSLYLSMSKAVFAQDDVNHTTDLNPQRKLGIFKLDINSQKLTAISNDYSRSYSYPTYIGNDKDSNHEMLLISKTVSKDDIPVNYKEVALLKDEYDRDDTPLIHTLDTSTGIVTRIGFNNSHQTEPTVINRDDDVPLVVFTQWEHQATVNRFSLWKMQIDGSDNFMFFGQEASSKGTAQNLYQARQIKSGTYKGYILMGQAGRTGNKAQFLAEGSILMTHRDNLDLRSDKIFLSTILTQGDTQTHIARNPEDYNAQSFIYSYRESTENTYKLYVKDYPTEQNATTNNDDIGELLIQSDSYHFVQARSFYPPQSKKVAPALSDLSENRVSFSNDFLQGNSGFLVHTIGFSNNGVQHQLNGIDTSELSMQFQIPSHHFSNSYALGLEPSQELSIPSSSFIAPEADGSLGVILKEGLYIWKIHKKFAFSDGANQSANIWIPVRAERQEVSFVANRVNACNQCHQDRNQDNIDKYQNYHSTAESKMKGSLADVIGTDKDISDYNASKNIPDFHKDIAPLFKKESLSSNLSCISCHNATDKLNLANATGFSALNLSYRNLVLGAHKIKDSNVTLPYLYAEINPMGMDDNYHPAPFLWSLLLNDDLSVAPDSKHPDATSRNLDRNGDYGATFSQSVSDEITRINSLYDHSKHWSIQDTQALIEYSSNRLAVGLSDKMSFVANTHKNDTNQAQKAYQALVKNCYDCHNNHTTEGLNDKSFTAIIPKEKRFSDAYYLQDSIMRFSIYSHIAKKEDSQYSQYLWQSNIRDSMNRTLTSAMYRINFADLNNSEILVYARGYYLEKNGTQRPLNSHIKAHQGYMSQGDSEYLALENWVKNIPMSNALPTMQSPLAPIVIKEYDAPAFIGETLRWSDNDNELSQLFLSKENSSEHIFNDSMLALEYINFESAKLKAYAMLGDRGEHYFTFSISDGLDSGLIYKVPVTITTDYIVPKPSEILPKSYLFFTDRATGMLKKLDSNATEINIGIIDGFNNDWTTVYRRADKGWLYFNNQEEQKIYVVDENTAEVLFDITLNHSPNKVGTRNKHTLYLLWWRPAEGKIGDANYSAGELQGLLESKLSTDTKKNGDFYVSLGSGENNETTIIPEWRTKLIDGGNTLDVYVWKRATFMTKLVNAGVDRMNVLNLVTGKAKYLNDFNFTAKNIDGIDYNASVYANVRAIVVAEDGAFYGFNKDINQDPEAFSFDPLQNIQSKVMTPQWIKDYISHYTDYATPFFVIEKRGDTNASL